MRGGIAHVVVALLLVAATAIGLFVYRQFFSPIVYAVPLLVAALLLPPRSVRVVALLVAAGAVATALVTDTQVDVRIVRLLSIFAIAYLAYQLSEERERNRSSALQSETSRREVYDILESIGDSFMALDRQWRFTYVNARAEGLLERSRDELIGREIWGVFPEAVNSTFWREYHRAISEGVSVAFEEYYPPLGRWFDVSAYPSPTGISVYFRDVTKRRRAEMERERLLAQLGATIASMPDGVILYGLNGEVLRANPAAHRLMLGAVDLGKTPTEGGADALRAETAEGEPIAPENSPVCRALRGETVVGEVQPVPLEGGRTLWISSSAAPVRLADGRQIGAISVLRDITDVRRLQEQRAKHVLGISHGLRTPLTVIQGQSQLLLMALERAKLNGRMHRSAEAIVASSQRMSMTLRDLVDLTSLESGQRLHLNPVALEPRAFALQLKERLSAIFPTERIGVEAGDDLPEVWADPDRLERVLVNLLSNAFKFSRPETEVTLRFSPGKGEVLTEVVDRGVGIPPEQFPHLFDPYQREDADQEPGESTGLGLYVARGLVESMGGRIWAESEPGRGSTFSFTLLAAG